MRNRQKAISCFDSGLLDPEANCRNRSQVGLLTRNPTWINCPPPKREVPRVALEKLDQPIVFAFAITFTVIGMTAVLGWLFHSLHWTGPLGLVKGGVM